MKKILLFGAGKSATVLIDYLLKNAKQENWELTVVDADIVAARQKTGGHVLGKALSFDIRDEDKRTNAISGADIVISMLPPALHFLVAEDCVRLGKNLLTASYLDEKLKSLADEIERKGLLFICEMGLDPGIDHMSAMRIIHSIQNQNAVITSFKSHCGGLVAPESDDNPWHYKISWNPRNVVLAGKAGAVYKENSEVIEKEYLQVFENCPSIHIDDLPELAWYPNRDSLSYMPVYGLENAHTFIRTTLRYASYCRGWNIIIHLGLTNTEDEKEIKEFSTINDWFLGKLKKAAGKQISWIGYLDLFVKEERHTELTEQIDFLGFFEPARIPVTAKCSADILQHLLETKWVLQPMDKDMIVMLHEIEYTTGMQQYGVNSALVVIGENNLHTAMAKTVGLPLAIAAKLILNGTIKTKGLHIPIIPEIYDPVLNELELQGVQFREIKI
ncbi:MAG: saccharopine dehydrogenase NADP-binding domain-containing protein [Bacteroidetes bacterium]|nr:saccharopine dehydrogenase NADP-binding domain-containing protein [Bacteroidota bacterium]